MGARVFTHVAVCLLGHCKAFWCVCRRLEGEEILSSVSGGQCMAREQTLVSITVDSTTLLLFQCPTSSVLGNILSLVFISVPHWSLFLNLSTHMTTLTHTLVSISTRHMPSSKHTSLTFSGFFLGHSLRPPEGGAVLASWHREPSKWHGMMRSFGKHSLMSVTGSSSSPFPGSQGTLNIATLIQEEE